LFVLAFVEICEIRCVSNLLFDFLSEQSELNHKGELRHWTVSSSGHDGFVIPEIAGESVFGKNAFYTVPPSVDGVLTFQNDHPVVQGKVQGEGVAIAEGNQDDDDKLVELMLFHINLAIGR